MNLKEYQELSRETAIYPDAGNNIIYPTLGLVGEIGETLEKVMLEAGKEEIEKEFGDIMWYIAQLASELEFDLINKELEEIYEFLIQEETLYHLNTRDESYDLNEWVVCASKIAEVTKKVMRDSGGVCPEEKKVATIDNLVRLIYHIKKSCELCGSSLSNICQMNIDKLFSRKERGVLQGSGDNR